MQRYNVAEAADDIRLPLLQQNFVIAVRQLGKRLEGASQRHAAAITVAGGAFMHGIGRHGSPAGLRANAKGSCIWLPSILVQLVHVKRVVPLVPS